MKDRLGSSHLFRNVLKLNILKATTFVVGAVIIMMQITRGSKITEALDYINFYIVVAVLSVPNIKTKVSWIRIDYADMSNEKHLLL